MKRENLAKALADIVHHQKNVQHAKDTLAHFDKSEGTPRSDPDGFLMEGEIERIKVYETHLNALEVSVKGAEERLQNAINTLLSQLPKTVQDALKERGQVITAGWVDEGVQTKRYGPTAMYYKKGELIIEPYTEYFAFKDRIKNMRLEGDI
ncbi:hypothetical protein HER32_06555 [Hymenobacter sp. BT18]|uniref:hypothetical protein n=1 Tax=Hymenobacter sp. BT18 TaxID=2835648 RepID=UPI00143EC61E|nr:hypothetical protein [Hymenobacter sp. BT18]QIX60853.1 hypothetical protein HER32_06555 [Hymenobacter sp. BT18]